MSDTKQKITSHILKINKAVSANINSECLTILYQLCRGILDAFKKRVKMETTESDMIIIANILFGESKVGEFAIKNGKKMVKLEKEGLLLDIDFKVKTVCDYIPTAKRINAVFIAGVVEQIIFYILDTADAYAGFTTINLSVLKEIITKQHLGKFLMKKKKTTTTQSKNNKKPTRKQVVSKAKQLGIVNISKKNIQKLLQQIKQKQATKKKNQQDKQSHKKKKVPKKKTTTTIQKKKPSRKQVVSKAKQLGIVNIAKKNIQKLLKQIKQKQAK